jgi:hypothetical protein
MFGHGVGWGVTPMGHTLAVVVGGLSTRPVVVGSSVEDTNGAFTFDNLMAGSGTTLLVSASGCANADPLPVDLPSDTGLSFELYPLTPPVQVPL